MDNQNYWNGKERRDTTEIETLRAKVKQQERLLTQCKEALSWYDEHYMAKQAGVLDALAAIKKFEGD